MNIHLDSDNPITLEQKVKELILKKLFIKVDDSRIFINKEDFLNLLLLDIIILAKSESEEDALELALEVQPHYKANPTAKQNELTEAADDFEVEINAYQYFLNADEEESEEEIYDNCLYILNSDTELLEKKLAELITISLSQKISEETALKEGLDYELLLSTYVSHVKLLAYNDTIEEAADEFYYNNKEEFIKNKVTVDFIQKELERLKPLLQEEINIYKMAISVDSQNAEIPAILAMVKQFLNIEN